MASRRDFLNGMMLFGAASMTQTSLFANENSIKWDEEWDVLVVGSGFAGSAATCQAIEEGAKTLMIDKMPVLGGNSAINGGAIAVVNSSFQKDRGIKDSYELYVKDILKAGLGLNRMDLVEVIAKNGNSAYEWTLQKGVYYRNALGQFGGHSVPRTIWPEINSGGKITIPLQEFAMKNGATIRTRVILDDFVRDESGKIIGAKVRENYDFDFDTTKDEADNKSGTVKFYKIKGGIVMATGGFSYDVKFRQEIDPAITPELDCTNHYGATAYALKTMMRNNVKTVDLKWIQLGPWGSPDEKGFGIAPVFAIPAFSYGIMVDARTGKRFVNELADRKIRSDAILKMHKNPDGSITHPVVICDSVGAQGTTKANVYRGIHKNVIKVFDTLKELADFYNIPYEGLKQSVDNYTKYARNGKDEEFGKPFFKFKDVIPDLTKPPFYAWRALPKVHHTMGGVKIDTEARVYDNDDKPIEGLFAAGEAVGGPHGASRLGSCAIPDCLVFGRIAGKNAANLAKKG
ncbi:flavocytochrome c [Campylobacter pinnipediorum subsp. caledonicus]|uniref:Flavocytochrome c n=1 Tax=Campylobacter pinnipediorum subsp. caledonicus TaxID=1874362 RepID=A0A1S6U7W2_9BACT|nr:flavocytochrome c [Campylobacter pinnipediorum]AQW86241.1 flavocytochrome c [Campylobacter pinnipediorum subsp. caledonicus]AQW87848.1 flavocytochrome c [Campylobacter pinnipediorum subsp. caledonicus]OPA71994.1 flavocytochrome c [Campylobacter pinnipediorum subsp. caledonicus]OPA78277.1 flavocytochrome c [Campylobacter pinnipediorum subsp. pinnipediorum]